jgi:peroxiredoxin
VGNRVERYSLPGLNGGTEEAPWAKGHPAVLIFFASWCIPCQGEMPKVAAYISTHPSGNVVVMGIDSSDAQPLAQAFTRKDHVTFPVAFDASNAVTSGIFKFGQIPETVFVDGSGIVKQVYYGAIPVGQLSSGIDALRMN